MTIKIASNIASTQAQRRLAEATSSLDKIYERLSSGQRINRASDDAAGLAIADDLSLKKRVNNQAIRNGNDAISILNIADSAIEALSDIAIRISELAEQSANGSYSSKQREALNNEAQELKAEFFRISKTTTFNGVKLFDGSLGDGLRVQLGFGTAGSINTSIGGAIGTGELASAADYNTQMSGTISLATGDINGDGILDIVSSGYASGDGFVSVMLGSGNGNFGNLTLYTAENTFSLSVALGDINNDGILDLVSAGQASGTGSATIRIGNGNGTFGAAYTYTMEATTSNSLSLADLNNDGALDLVTAGSGSGSGKATIRLGNGNGTFGTATSYTTETNASYDLSLADLNSDNVLDLITAGAGYTTIRLGTGNGSFGAASSLLGEAGDTYGLEVGDLNGDGILDIVTAGQAPAAAGGKATIRLGTGDGTFGAAASLDTEGFQSIALELGDLNGDGILDIITAGQNSGGYYEGNTLVRLGLGNGSFGTATLYTSNTSNQRSLTAVDINSDGVLDLLNTETGAGGSIAIRFGITEDGIAPISDFSLETSASALQAIGILKTTQDNLINQRGTIGANQSRLNIAINYLSNSNENISAAESRIRDTDIAQDSANLIRTQILQQAAAAVLAQANQTPQIALMLLK